MSAERRMSPLTALFMGISLVLTTAVASGAAVILYGLRIIDHRSEGVVGLVQHVFDGVPELAASLPPVLSDLLHDRRAPEYVSQLDVDVAFVRDEDGDVRPVLTIENKGTEMVSLLAVRVAALSASGTPLGEWTEIVATPLAVDDEWRGPLLPGSTRHVMLSGWLGESVDPAELTGTVEIADIRVWTQPPAAGEAESGKSGV